MSSKSAAALDRRTNDGGAGFIGYLTVGYPDLETSIEAGHALVDAGVDIIELGLPYSDPGMDGPVIQHTGQLALDAGTRTRHVLRAVEALSGRVPVLVMTYYNPVHRYGVEAFARDLAAAGVRAAAGPADLSAARAEVARVEVGPEVLGYIVDLVQATRTSPSVSLGVSPRGATALLATARAWAWLSGRSFVTPDDVKALAVPTLRHRLQLRAEAELEGVTPESVLGTVLNSVPVPR